MSIDNTPPEGELSYGEKFVQSLEPLMQPVGAGLESLGKISGELLKSAGNALAGLIGLGGLIPTNSASSNRGNDNETSAPQASFSVPVVPPRVVAPEIAVQQAMENTINRLPESVRAMVDKVRDDYNANYTSKGNMLDASAATLGGVIANVSVAVAKGSTEVAR